MYAEIKGPIFIGGLGGSGTRIVAQLFKNAGVFIGKKTNKALDNRLFHIFSKPSLSFVINDPVQINERIKCLVKISTEPNPELEDFIHLLKYLPSSFNDKIKNRQQLIATIIDEYCPEEAPQYWGFKNPRSHFFCKYILDYLPESKFIYVMRNGLDMAYSDNVRQIWRFGDIYNLKVRNKPTPYDIFRFWSITYDHMNRIKHRYPDRVYILKYEDLVNNAADISAHLLDFSEIKYDKNKIHSLSEYIIKPYTIERYKKHDLSWLDNEMKEQLYNAGYTI